MSLECRRESLSLFKKWPHIIEVFQMQPLLLLILVVKIGEISDAFRRDSVSESGLSIPISNDKVSLVDNIHADQNVCANEIPFGDPQVGEQDHALQPNTDHIGVCHMSFIYTVNERLPCRNQVALLNHLFRYDAVRCSSVPKGLEGNKVLRHLLRTNELGHRTVADQLVQQSI